MSDQAALLLALEQAAGPGAVRTDRATLASGAADLYETGPEPVAVVRPESVPAVARTVAATLAHGGTVVPRGGGLSYTGGYLCQPGNGVLLDLSALDAVEEIDETDLFVTAQAGATWRRLHELLAPRGLRLRFFGPFSGLRATIGGGLSHGAVFFGSARYGSAADNVLALEVALADGTLMRTGQWALRADRKPVYRGFGPDLTGLFLHDGGALGVKTRAALPLMRTPAATGFASFAFRSFDPAALALSDVARAGVAEDAYVLDPSSLDAVAAASRDLGAAAGAARAVARSAGGALAAIRALADLARGARTLAPPGSVTLHCVVAGSSRAAVAADLATTRSIARAHGARAIAASIPRIARADPFPHLNGVLGPGGGRWAALNAKVAHSEGVPLIHAHQALIARHSGEMAARGVRVSYLLSALGTQSFSFETVFHWLDRWLPLHVGNVDPAVLATLREPEANPAGRALVAELRQATVALFRDFGAASNQIGRAYPYIDTLDGAPAALLRSIKQLLDPEGRMNPGVLGL